MSARKRVPYETGISLEDAHQNSHNNRLAVEEAREEYRAAEAAFEEAQIRLNATMQGTANLTAEGRSSSSPHPRPRETQQMPFAEHGPGGLSSNNMSVPSADTSVDPNVAGPPVDSGPKKNDTRLGQGPIRRRGLPGTHPANYSRHKETQPDNSSRAGMKSGGTSGNIAHEYANIDPGLLRNSSTPNYGGPGYFPGPYQNPNIDPDLLRNSSTPNYGGPGYFPGPYQNPNIDPGLCNSSTPNYGGHGYFPGPYQNPNIDPGLRNSSVPNYGCPGYFPGPYQNPNIDPGLRNSSAPNYGGPGYFPDPYQNPNIDPGLRNSSVPNYGGPGYFPDPYQNNNSAPYGPANNITSNGSLSSNEVQVPIAIPARSANEYVSPYTEGSVRYFGAMGYPHDRGRTVGELVPGYEATSPGSSQIYEYPEPPEYNQPYNDQEFTNQSSVAETAPSNFEGSQIYRSLRPGEERNPREGYLDPNQYLSHLTKVSPELYGYSSFQVTQAPSMVHDGIRGFQGVAFYVNQAPNQTHHEMIAPVDNSTYKKPVERSYRKSNQKRLNGTLYDKNGHLPLPLEHYREYMNGLREMNGKLATPELAPVPCKYCAENGLTCRRLTRENDHGGVFTRMRKPWRNQEVSNYIVCANCWVSSKPQGCSFWRRPEGKEEPPRRYIKTAYRNKSQR